MTYSVLIVDDSLTAVPELKSLLESDGYTVLTALRAEDALDMLRNSKIDLVISEALLPGMDGFELVRQVRRNDSWAQIPIIMLTVRSAPEDYATSYEAGADEYFLKPMEPPKIIAAARGLLTRYEMARTLGDRGGALQIVGRQSRNTVSSSMPVRSERGKIITVFSLKGGVGTSTLAVNLAVGIKKLAPSTRVGLIDLSLEEGSDALLLDVVPTSTIYDWAREDLTEATPYLLNQYFVQHRTGIALMAAPPSPEQAETVRADVVRLTCTLAPDTFDYVVLDTASTFSENTLIALEAANDIVIPITPDIAALKNAVSTMRILQAVNIDSSRIQMVLNEVIPRAGLSKQQIEQSLGKTVTSIPHAGSLFVDALNHGAPPAAGDASHPLTKALLELAKQYCEPEMEEATAPRQKFGLFDRLEKLRPS